MTSLTGWCSALSADLLLEPDATVGAVGAVAKQVGDGSPFAFRSGFKGSGASARNSTERSRPARSRTA